MPGTRQRVDNFWRSVFGAETAGGAGRLVVTGHREPLADYAGVHCVLREQAVFISAPEWLAGTVAGWRPSG